MTDFNCVVLDSDPTGRSRFREQLLELPFGTDQVCLSPLFHSAGYQIRQSPVGFRSQFHCSAQVQFVFVLSGAMEVGLQDGSARQFLPGQHFLAADLLLPGRAFDLDWHGHCSRQVGPDPLVTLFVRTSLPEHG